MSKKIMAPAYLAAIERAESDPSAARFWVGLDVGYKNTAVCVVDCDGAIVHQVSMKSSATEIGRYLRKNFKSHVTLIGMESGGLAPHLTGKLRGQGFQVAVLDARQVHRVLSVKRNKTDTNDARGIAEITRTGREYLTEVYVKSNLCFEIRAYLTMRDRLVKQRRETEAMIRGLVRVYGGRIEGGTETAASYRSRAIDQMCLIADAEGIDLRPRIIPLLDLCEGFYVEANRIERELELLAASNPVCRRFMEIPGVGTITAVSFYSAIEDPTRFRHVDDVAAYPIWFGTPPAMLKGYVERVLGAGVTPHDVRDRHWHPLLSGKRLLSFSTSAMSNPWLAGQDQSLALRTVFDDYLAHAFSMTRPDHFHFGSISANLPPADVDRHLAKVGEEARHVCMELDFQRRESPPTEQRIA